MRLFGSSQLRENPVSRNDYRGRPPQERAMDFKDHIRAIPQIRHSETFVYLRLTKQTYTWGTR